MRADGAKLRIIQEPCKSGSGCGFQWAGCTASLLIKPRPSAALARAPRPRPEGAIVGWCYPGVTHRQISANPLDLLGIILAEHKINNQEFGGDAIRLACLIHRIAGIRRRVSRKVVIVTYELGA